MQILNNYLKVGTVNSAHRETGKRRRQYNEVDRPIPISNSRAIEVYGASIASLASHPTADGSSVIRSSRNGFSAERLYQNQRGHSGIIRAIECSDDGSLLVSGGDGIFDRWSSGE